MRNRKSEMRNFFFLPFFILFLCPSRSATLPFGKLRAGRACFLFHANPGMKGVHAHARKKNSHLIPSSVPEGVMLIW